MARILVLVLLVIALQNQAWAYSMATEVETKVLSFDGTNLELEVYDAEDFSKSPYTKGTKLSGKVTKHREAKRFLRDEYFLVQIDKANGANEDLLLKVQPRSVINPRRVGNLTIGSTALVLGLTIDVLTLGLPISRGGLAVWNSVNEVHERPVGDGKTKHAVKGFLKGAFFPLPQVFGKAANLSALQPGARVSFERERKGDHVDAIVRPPRDLL